MGTGGAGQVPDTLVTARPAAGRDSEAAARRTPSRFGIDPDKGVASAGSRAAQCPHVARHSAGPGLALSPQQSRGGLAGCCVGAARAEQGVTADQSPAGTRRHRLKRRRRGRALTRMAVVGPGGDSDDGGGAGRHLG